MPHTLLPNGRKLTFRSKYAVQVPAPREGHIPDVALHARRFKSPMMTCSSHTVRMRVRLTLVVDSE